MKKKIMIKYTGNYTMRGIPPYPTGVITKDNCLSINPYVIKYY